MTRTSLFFGPNVTLLTAASLVLLTACSSSVDNGSNDAGGTSDAPAPNDSGAVPDGTTQDSSVSDSGTPDSTVTDTGSGDSASPDSSPVDSGPPGDSGPAEAGGDAGGFCATSTNVATGKTMVALACNQNTPSGIAVHNGYVYWTNYAAGGTVMSVPEAGGTPTVVATNQDWPWAIVVDDNNVYWTTYDSGGAAFPNGAAPLLGAIWKVGVTNGAPVGQPVMLDSALAGPAGIAIDPTNVYFTTYTGNKIKSVPIAGGAETVLAVLPVGPTAGPLDLVVDSTKVYYETQSGGVYSIAKTAVSGTPSTVVNYMNVTGGFGIALGGTTLFFADQGQGGNVYKVPVGGGTQPTVLASGQNVPSLLAVSSTTVYWTDYLGDQNGCAPNCGNVSSVPIGGGAVTVEANLLDYPEGIAVDGTAVYFAAASGGRVWKLSPP